MICIWFICLVIGGNMLTAREGGLIMCIYNVEKDSHWISWLAVEETQRRACLERQTERKWVPKIEAWPVSQVLEEDTGDGGLHYGIAGPFWVIRIRGG